MAVNFPLTLPVAPNAYTLERNSVNILNISPYTLQQQVIRGIGEGWSLKLNFAPQVDLNTCIAMSGFLSSLRGVYGTFYFGPPQSRLKFSLGTGPYQFPYLKSINNTLRDNITVGPGYYPTTPPYAIVYSGTFISVGSQLVQILTATTPNGSGNIVCDIFPALRSDYPTNYPINHYAPQGVFRLKQSSAATTFNADHTETLSLEAVEAII